jgi:hypothetical protein
MIQIVDRIRGAASSPTLQRFDLAQAHQFRLCGLSETCGAISQVSTFYFLMCVCRDVRFTGGSIAVLSSQRAGLQIYRLAQDVVAESEAARPDALLAIVGLHALELLYEVAPSTVVGVLL